MTDAKREPWLLILLKAQFFTKDAEAMGKSPWIMLPLVLVVTALLAAFPFINDKQVNAIRSSDPALYPGLENVFREIGNKKWDLHVEGKTLVTGPGVPAQTRVGKWLVVIEPAGGSQQVLSDAFGSNSGTTQQKIVFFGKVHFGIFDQSTGAQFDGTYEQLGWFGPEALQKIPLRELTVKFLFMAATVGFGQVQAAVSLLMFVQVVFLVFILGFLLSLSRIQVRGLSVNKNRAVGFFSSLRTAGAVSLGPALLCCVALTWIPGAGAISWVVYTLFYGVRIIVLYMARFPNKRSLATSGSRQ